MKYDHIPDMNHDGKINSHDCALFHEMLDEKQKNEPLYSTRGHSGGNEPWTIYHSFAKGLLLLLLGGCLVLLFSGTIPINIFTALLGVFSLSAFVRTLIL